MVNDIKPHVGDSRQTSGNYINKISKENIRPVRLEILSYECPREMYEIIIDIKNRFGKNIFSRLKEIKAEEMDSISPYGGDCIYDDKQNIFIIIIDVTYFALNPKKSAEFKKVFMYQIGHYLFKAKKLYTIMYNICNDEEHKEYIKHHYNFDHIKNPKVFRVLSEIFAQAFFEFCENRLEKDLNGKTNQLFYLIQLMEAKHEGNT